MEAHYCSRVKGKGLFSTKEYFSGEIVFTLSGDILDRPTKYSIHIGNNRHIMDTYGVYMNHSFTPTTEISGVNVIALQDIEINDELNFNYNHSELKMAYPFIADNILVEGNKNCGD